MKKTKTQIIFIGVIFCLTLQTVCEAQNATLPLPRLNIGVDQTTDPNEFTSTMQIFVVLTVLSIAPSFLIMMTSFTRFIVVFAFLRQGLSIPQIPPNQVLAALALFLTFFVMSPVINEINDNALQPYLDREIPQEIAFQNAIFPIREFMFRQTRNDDILMMQKLAGRSPAQTRDDLPTHILIPAFMISELTTAFTIGFILFIPFLVIDMVVASILMAMGMMMLPPVSISLPFKILLFVLIDGWSLVTSTLIMNIQ